MKKAVVILAALGLFLAGCESADPEDVVDSGRNEIVDIQTDDGVLHCVIITYGDGGSKTQTMGVDCQWPGER